MKQVRLNRRVNIRFTMRLADNEPEMYGDLMVPEPDLAGDLVSVLLYDWTVSEINITAENSEEEVDDGTGGD